MGESVHGRSFADPSFDGPLDPGLPDPPLGGPFPFPDSSLDDPLPLGLTGAPLDAPFVVPLT